MFTQLQGLPKKKTARFCTVHILDLSLHWENIFRRRFHPLKIQLLSQRSWSKENPEASSKKRRRSQKRKDVQNPDVWLAKNPEKKWFVWNVSTIIRLGGFKYVSLNVQPVAPWGNDPI